MESVESIVRAYFAALNRSDVDGVVALFAEDGSFLPDESPTATGREQIRRAFEGSFQDLPREPVGSVGPVLH